jgi:hypothetical protein
MLNNSEPKLFLQLYEVEPHRGATSREVAGSIPDDVTGISH